MTAKNFTAPQVLQQLSELVRSYRSPYPEEQAMQQRVLQLIAEHNDCLYRSSTEGHLTASAWITDRACSQVLMLHHAKLQTWLPPGGHADGMADLQAVAMKEAYEETGIGMLEAVSDAIFDLDVHFIPTHKTVGAHWHHNLGFHFSADPTAPLQLNHESHDLRWIPLNKLSHYNNSPSLARLVAKTQKIRAETL